MNNILQTWQDHVTATTHNFINHANEAACFKLQSSAASFASLGTADEEIFESLQKLMLTYQLISATEIDPEDSIMEGLCQILTAALTAFEDLGQRIEYPPPYNPISEEKEQILAQAKDSIIQSGWTTLEDLYTAYCQALTTAITNLNNLPQRSAATTYMDFMQLQCETLENLITLKPDLDILVQAYQSLTPVVQNLQNLLQSPPKEYTIDDQAAFIAIMPSPVELDKTDPIFAEPITKLFAQASYTINQNFSKAKFLAMDILQLFCSLYNALPDKIENPHALLDQGREGEVADKDENIDLQIQILLGIRETILIKIESLEEYIQEFNPPPPEDATPAKIEHIIDQWLKSPADFDLAKITAPMVEKTNKQIFRFKKETLLYEISTYEEILTHSAARLQDATLPKIAQAEKDLHEIYKNLQSLLKKHNILPIHPAPHTKFDARHHEILVAESNPDFEKGQIIKVINTGYTQDDQVIIRANVIAAK